MKKRIFFASLLTIFLTVSAYSWEGVTHRGITNRMEGQNKILDNYLIKLGFADGAEKTFYRLYEGEYYTPPKFLDRTETRESMPPWNLCVGSLNRSALDWLVGAAAEEDCPEIRAANHFHDPTNGLGWRERSEVTAIG